MKLSIIIPVFNEEKTVLSTIKKVLDVKISDVSKEIIIVDDGSEDNTFNLISDFIAKLPDNKNIKIFKNKTNQGKGVAVEKGIKNASGDYILIQDADSEYDPKYIPELFLPIQKKQAEVVYGTRLKRFPHPFREERTFRFFIHYFGNRMLSLLTSILYGQWITDMETGYKLFSRNSIKNINFNSKGFDFEPEITAKLLKKGYQILEIPITTVPRGYTEGKKLNTIRDGIIALRTLIKYKFTY